MNKCRINDCPLHSDNECPRYDQDSLDGCRMYEKQKVLWDFADRFEDEDETGHKVHIHSYLNKHFIGHVGILPCTWNESGDSIMDRCMKHEEHHSLVPNKPQAPKEIYLSSATLINGSHFNAVTNKKGITNPIKYIREDK